MPEAGLRGGIGRAAEAVSPNRHGSPWLASEEGSRCDYLLVGADNGPNHDLYVAPLELKSSGFHAHSVARQLAGGTRAAEKIVPKARCRFVPVVAHRGAHRREINRLARHPVRYRGKPHAIRLMRCGDELAEALA